MANNSDIIYLDHCATTPVRPEALEAMLPYFSEHYGNPSSLHRLGRQTGKALRKAHEQIAGVANAYTLEVVVYEKRSTSPLSSRIGAAQMAELRSRFRLVVSGASAADGAEPGASQRIIIHATRGAWGAIGNILSYLGPLLVMLALFVSEQGGWREQGINLAPGQTWQLRARPGITLEASDIGSTSHLTVTVGGQADAVSLGPEAAAAPRGLRLLSTGSGPALQVTVTDSNGRPLSLRPLTSGNQATQQTLIFDRAQIEQSLALPLRSQVLRLVYYASLPEQGYAGPVFLAQALTLGSETPVFSTFLQEHAQTAVTDPTTQDTFHFTATRYVQLAAIFDPGLPLALIGGLLTFMGLLLAQSQPPARAWAWLNGQADETAATLALLGSGPWTRAELAALQDALAGMVASGTPLHADTAPRAASVSDF